MSKQPFSSDYDEGANATSSPSEVLPAVFQPDDYVPAGTETPVVGKPYGTGKPHRIKIRGKISRD